MAVSRIFNQQSPRDFKTPKLTILGNRKVTGDGLVRGRGTLTLRWEEFSISCVDCLSQLSAG